MQLTQYSDYAIRMLVFLGAHKDENIPVSLIAACYGISANHLAKVGKMLTREGFVQAQRGKGGGLRLGRKPSQIRLGEVVRRTEPGFDLVECFNLQHNTCPIAGACEVQRVLHRAREAFLCVLDEVTLEELLHNQSELVQLLGVQRHLAA